MRAKVLLWATVQLPYISLNFVGPAVFKISETWARSLKFSYDFRLLRLYKFNWLVLVYAHSKILVDVRVNICRVTEWAQKSHIQSKETVTERYHSAVADDKSLHSCGAFSTWFFWKSHVLPISILSSPVPLCLIIKELQKAIDNRKAIILSINLCSSEFTQSDSEESKKLQERLSQMNVRWDHVCNMIEEWRCSLQDALMQCQVCLVLILNCQHPTYQKCEPYLYLVCTLAGLKLAHASQHTASACMFWNIHLHYLKHVFPSSRFSRFVISGIVFWYTVVRFLVSYVI